MLKILPAHDAPQERLTTSPLLRRWTRAQERLALIKSQSTWRRGPRNAAARRRELELLRPLDPETDGSHLQLELDEEPELTPLTTRHR